MNGKGGGRQGLRYIVGDVPRCIRSKEEATKSSEKMKEKGSSSKTKHEGSSKEDEKKDAVDENKVPGGSSIEEKENKDQSGSSIEDDKTLQKREPEKEVNFLVIQRL